MEVFHYVANQLENEPLFSESSYDVTSGRVGAIYNDVDYDPVALLNGDDEAPFCFSQTSNIAEARVTTVADCSSRIREGVEHAILEADRSEGGAYADLTFNSVNFDIESKQTTDLYMDKVYKIISGDRETWEDLVITKKAIKVFRMRYNNEWKEPDSVYDAWLLVERLRRKEFSLELFMEKYPDYFRVVDLKKEQFGTVREISIERGEVREHETSCDSDSESSSTSSSCLIGPIQSSSDSEVDIEDDKTEIQNKLCLFRAKPSEDVVTLSTDSDEEDNKAFARAKIRKIADVIVINSD